MSVYSNTSEKRIEKLVEAKNTSFGKIFPLIGKKVKSVLDVGCSTGYFGRYLKDKLGVSVWGLEINKEDAQKAKKVLDNVIIGDIETLDFKKHFGQKKFDLVIFADVLEHLKNPAKALKRVKSVLKPSGQVMASIPNVAHQSVRLQLLAGQWNYEEMGLLDKTHLRFFDYHGVVKLFESAGYFIKKIRHTVNDIPTELLKEFLEEAKISPTPQLLELLSSPEAKIYQYIVKAGIKKPKGYKSYLSKQERLLPVSDWSRHWQKSQETIKKQSREIKDIQLTNKQLVKQFKISQKHSRHLQDDIDFLNKEVSKLKNVNVKLKNVNVKLKNKIMALEKIRQLLSRRLDHITSQRLYKIWKKYSSMKRKLVSLFTPKIR